MERECSQAYDSSDQRVWAANDTTAATAATALRTSHRRTAGGTEMDNTQTMWVQHSMGQGSRFFPDQLTIRAKILNMSVYSDCFSEG